MFEKRYEVCVPSDVVPKILNNPNFKNISFHGTKPYWKPLVEFQVGDLQNVAMYIPFMFRVQFDTKLTHKYTKRLIGKWRGGGPSLRRVYT